MQIRMRATAVRSLTLLAILCFILEALVVYRLFVLRDLQQSVLQLQVEAQQVERALSPTIIFSDRDAPIPLVALSLRDDVVSDACCAVPLQLLNEAHKASSLNDYSRAYSELLRGLDGYSAVRRDQIDSMLKTNAWLPYIATVILVAVFLIAWQILQNNFLGQIGRAHV